jgi:hypothetical protein
MTDLVKKAFDETRVTLPRTWVQMGGVHTPKPALQARWTFEAAQDAMASQGIDIEAEIADALTQEISAELMQKLLKEARAVAKPTERLSLSGLDEMVKGAIRLHELANELDPRSIIIVSPTFMTVIQAGAGDLFVRRESTTYGDMKPVGDFAGHKVFIDPYARDDVPALLCSAEWFNFESGTVFYEGSVQVDPMTFEPVMKFYDDVKFTVDASKVHRVDLDVHTLRFY